MILVQSNKIVQSYK